MQLLENNRYKLTIAYDGTDYHGWQIQPHCLSIAQAIQDTFINVFNHPCKLVGASRTDAGVHALGQVGLLTSSLAIEPERLRFVLNNHLPSSLLIRKIQRADLDFHPQRNVRQKTYYYHFFTCRPLPFVSRYGAYYRFPLSLEKLNNCLQVFVGTHDFRSFCTGDEMETTVKTITSITVHCFKRFNIYRIEIRGHSFARFMIRRIVGASLYVASHSTLQSGDLRAALAQCNPLQPYPTAPAQGLMLARIAYL